MDAGHEEKQSWVFDWWDVLLTIAIVILAQFNDLAQKMLVYFWLPLLAGMTIGSFLQSLLAYLLYGPGRDHWDYQAEILPWPSQVAVRAAILGLVVVAVVYGSVLTAPPPAQRIALVTLMYGSAIMGIRMVRHVYFWNKYVRRKRED